jgi:hypothetical protein
MSLPAAFLSKKLTQPLPIKAGGVLRTIRCVTTYMQAMPHERVQGCQHWRHAAQLLLEQADVAAVSRQVYLALSLDNRLDFGALS